MTRIVAIDFETADYGADSACALGMARVVDGRIVATKAFLIRPPRKRFAFTYIHGLTWADVEDAMTFAERIPEIERFVSGANYLAAHNAPFDRAVLAAGYAAARRRRPEVPFLCTVRMARAAWGVRPTKLPDVCRYLGIALRHHDAASDALACARIAAAAIADGFPIETSRLRSPT
ncbi:MAG TPA: exonuclease domain-containing protein [Alphaproteobacteria bacterium]